MTAIRRRVQHRLCRLTIGVESPSLRCEARLTPRRWPLGRYRPVIISTKALGDGTSCTDLWILYYRGSLIRIAWQTDDHARAGWITTGVEVVPEIQVLRKRQNVTDSSRRLFPLQRDSPRRDRRGFCGRRECCSRSGRLEHLTLLMVGPIPFNML